MKKLAAKPYDGPSSQTEPFWWSRTGCEVHMMAPLGAYMAAQDGWQGTWPLFMVLNGRACYAWNDLDDKMMVGFAVVRRL